MNKVIFTGILLINMAISYSASAAIIGTQASAVCGDVKNATSCNVKIAIRDPLTGTVSADASRFLFLTVAKSANLNSTCTALSTELGKKLRALYPAYYNMYSRKMIPITGGDRFGLVLTVAYTQGNPVSCGGVF